MLRSYVILPIASCCQSLKYPALQLPCINWLQLTLQALVCLAAPYFVLVLLPAPCSLASQFPLYLLWPILATSVYRYCVLALHLYCLLLHLSASIPNLWTVVQSIVIIIPIVLKPAHFLRHFVLAIHALAPYKFLLLRQCNGVYSSFDLIEFSRRYCHISISYLRPWCSWPLHFTPAAVPELYLSIDIVIARNILDGCLVCGELM